MTLLYQPQGRAREYAALAANLYAGCAHGCEYCYAPAAVHQVRQRFAEARERPGVIPALEQEAAKLARLGRPVPPILLCFTCDPYQPLDDRLQITRQSIQVFKRYGLAFCVLTKGGRRALRDLDLYQPGDTLGATLTFLDPGLSRQWEPGAALPAERMDTLRQAHAAGISTWASLEPVIEPAQTLAIIEATHEYVDLYKVGKLNHHPRARAVDWPAFAGAAVEKLEGLQKAYYIKHDLALHLHTSQPMPYRFYYPEQIEELFSATPRLPAEQPLLI